MLLVRHLGDAYKVMTKDIKDEEKTNEWVQELIDT